MQQKQILDLHEQRVVIFFLTKIQNASLGDFCLMTSLSKNKY